MPGNGKTVVFMGSPDFAVPCLDALHGSGRYSPALVVSQPDRPRGRGQRVVPTPVRARAMEHGLPTDVMSRATYGEVVSKIAEIRPDVVCVTAFGIIVKSDLLDIPASGCVNVHASLLPRHRGVSPIQAAVLSGDDRTGCTTMLMDEGIDTGDMLLSEAIDIHPTDTAGSLSDRLSQLGAHLLVRTLDGLFDGSVEPASQDDALATYTKKIRKSHGHLDWTRDAESVWRRVRAMTPWPSAFTFLDGKRLIVLEAEPVSGDPDAEPGRVVSLDPFAVSCGDGALVLHRVKPEGAKAMAPQAYLAGHDIAVGSVLG